MGVYNVAQNGESSQGFWGEFYGPNLGYIEEQYEIYKEDPEAIDSSLKELFEQHGAPNWSHQTGGATQPAAPSTSIDVKKLTSAMKLVEAIRRYGHLEADIYPVGRDKNRKSTLVDPASYELTEEDLKSIPASWLWEEGPSNIENGLDVIKQLKKYYSGTITFEYDHVNNDDER